MGERNLKCAPNGAPTISKKHFCRYEELSESFYKLLLDELRHLSCLGSGFYLFILRSQHFEKSIGLV